VDRAAKLRAAPSGGVGKGSTSGPSLALKNKTEEGGNEVMG